MDIRDLKFETDSFDVAIDKGVFRSLWAVYYVRTHVPTTGTMDAMMTATADVWVSL